MSCQLHENNNGRMNSNSILMITRAHISGKGFIFCRRKKCADFYLLHPSPNKPNYRTCVWNYENAPVSYPAGPHPLDISISRPSFRSHHTSSPEPLPAAWHHLPPPPARPYRSTPPHLQAPTRRRAASHLAPAIRSRTADRLAPATGSRAARRRPSSMGRKHAATSGVNRPVASIRPS
jgi:hypothetical protein